MGAIWAIYHHATLAEVHLMDSWQTFLSRKRGYQVLSFEFWKESLLAAPSPLNLQLEYFPRGKKKELPADPGSHSWGFCSCPLTAEHHPAPQSPLLQHVVRSEKRIPSMPVFYKIVQHSLKERSDGQAVAVWSRLPPSKILISFEFFATSQWLTWRRFHESQRPPLSLITRSGVCPSCWLYNRIQKDILKQGLPQRCCKRRGVSWASF